MVKYFYPILISLTLIDQVSKYILKIFLTNPITIIPNFLSLTLRYNTGAGFSILSGQRILLILISIIILGFIFYYNQKYKNENYSIALGLIAGGAIGNLIDRIFLGHVTDFIEFSFWPTFNIADSAIFCGAAYLIYINIKKK